MASSSQARFVLIGEATSNTSENANASSPPATSSFSSSQQQSADGPMQQSNTFTDQPPTSSPAPTSPVQEHQNHRQPPLSSIDANSSPPPPSIVSVGMAPSRPKKGPAKKTAALKKGTAKSTPGAAHLSIASASAQKPKRFRPSSGGGSAAAKRPGGPRSRKKAAATAATTTTAIDPSPVDNDNDEESDYGPYCICRGPDDHRWMIACESCDDWFHGECVDLATDIGESLVDRFICPECERKNPNLRTRYKLTCSLDGCARPARLYSDLPGPDGKAVGLEGADAARRSAFCSDDHRDAWWAHWLARMPDASTAQSSSVSREQLLTLMGGRLGELDEHGSWRLLQPPFGHARDDCEGWMLTAEEKRILAASERERATMSDDVVLCQKMLQLLNMAQDRRRAAIGAKLIPDDGCGYDDRLDAVGTRAAFRAWATSTEGDAVFASGELLAAEDGRAAKGKQREDEGGNANGDDRDGDVAMGDDDEKKPAIASTTMSIRGMCDRKRCKPHMSWQKVLARTVKMQLRELSSGVSARVDREGEIKSAAVGRAKRRAVDPGHVELVGAV